MCVEAGCDVAESGCVCTSTRSCVLCRWSKVCHLPLSKFTKSISIFICKRFAETFCWCQHLIQYRNIDQDNWINKSIYFLLFNIFIFCSNVLVPVNNHHSIISIVSQDCLVGVGIFHVDCCRLFQAFVFIVCQPFGSTCYMPLEFPTCQCFECSPVIDFQIGDERLKVEWKSLMQPSKLRWCGCSSEMVIRLSWCSLSAYFSPLMC